MSNKNDFRKFEEIGEASVRQELAGRAWGEERKSAAREWLKLQESSERRASSSESLRIAKSAKKAAWVAAIAAIVASIAAIAALLN